MYKHNNKFFETEGILQSYWAGFLAADGCIYKYKTNRQSSLFFKLNKSDRHILEQFKKDIQAENPIHDVKTENTSQLILSLTEIEEIVLEHKWGLTAKKTFIFTHPKIKNINCKLAWIKGFIDGDGSIYLNTNPKKPRSHFRLIFLGTQSTLTWIQQTLNELNLLISNKISIKDNIFIFRLNGKKAYNVGKVIFNSIPNRGLNRKWDKLFIYGEK